MDLADDNADKPEPHSEDSYFSMGDGPELPTHRLLSHEIEWPLVPPPRRVTGIKGNADDDDQILRPSQSLPVTKTFPSLGLPVSAAPSVPTASPPRSVPFRQRVRPHPPHFTQILSSKEIFFPNRSRGGIPGV